MAKILCVDDEPNIVTLKCAILEAAGHEVTPSTSAHDAIDKLASNTYDAVVAFRDTHDRWGHMGFGTLVLVANAVMLSLYTVSCHSCRHIIGGRLKHFSRHPVRFRMWGWVSALNRRHMELAWISLVVVALADVYVRLVASGTITDPRFF